MIFAKKCSKFIHFFRLTTEVSRKQLGQFPSENLARNFEIFETHPIQEEVTIPSTINGFAQAKALLENVDKIRIPSYDEIFDYLRIAKKWRNGFICDFMVFGLKTLPLKMNLI